MTDQNTAVSRIDIIGSFDEQMIFLADADTVEAKVGRAIALATMEQAKQARIANLIAARAAFIGSPSTVDLADLDVRIAGQLDLL